MQDSCLNAALVVLSASCWWVADPAKRGPKIKINGIKRNPNLHLSDTEPEEELGHEPLHPDAQDQPPLEQQGINLDAVELQPLEELGVVEEVTQGESPQLDENMQEEAAIPEMAKPETQEPPHQPVEEELPVVTDQDVDLDLDALGQPSEATSTEEATGCPMNAQPTATGQCECIQGFEIDDQGSSCVLLRMSTAAEAAATSATFDILNAHHQIPSHSS